MESRSNLTPGVAVQIAPRVRRLVAGNAGLMTGPGTNTYLLGDASIAVLDPGPLDAKHLNAILSQAGAPIRWVVVTHTHADHSPLARELQRASGAELIGLVPPDDQRQDLTFKPDRVPIADELLHLGEVNIRAVYTPGHASNCVCYLDAEAGLLFSGDHILEGVSPVILPPDGSMTSYLESLEKLESLEFDRIAPGHGGVIQNAKRWIERLKRHRLNRESKVLDQLQKTGGGTVSELTPLVYDDVGRERHRWAQLTLEAHLIKLEFEHRAKLRDGVWTLASA